MKTILCERLGIELPIIQAPMGGAVGPKLAAAVSNAGGLGMLVLWRADADTMRQQIREIRALAPRDLSRGARSDHLLLLARSIFPGAADKGRRRNRHAHGGFGR